jgi:hypothetical protein
MAAGDADDGGGREENLCAGYLAIQGSHADGS